MLVAVHPLTQWAEENFKGSLSTLSSLRCGVGFRTDQKHPSHRYRTNDHFYPYGLVIRQGADCGGLVHPKVLHKVGGCCLHHNFPVCPVPNHFPVIGWKHGLVELTLVSLHVAASVDGGYGCPDGSPDN